MSRVVRLDYAYGVCPKCGESSYLRYLIQNDGLTHEPYEVKCINCNSYFRIADIRLEQKRRTHADRVRAMTDEELAEWFGRIQYDTAYYCAGEGEQKYPYPDGWLDWLRQEDTDEHYHSRG